MFEHIGLPEHKFKRIFRVLHILLFVGVILYLLFTEGGNPWGYVIVGIIFYYVLGMLTSGLYLLITKLDIKRGLLFVGWFIFMGVSLVVLYLTFGWLVKQPWYPFK